MNYTLHTAYSLLKSLFTFPAVTTGMLDCDPAENTIWLTETQVEQRLTEDGWLVRNVQQTGSCWKAYGLSPRGDRVKVYLHPGSGEVLQISQQGKVLYRKGG